MTLGADPPNVLFWLLPLIKEEKRRLCLLNTEHDFQCSIFLFHCHNSLPLISHWSSSCLLRPARAVVTVVFFCSWNETKTLQCLCLYCYENLSSLKTKHFCRHCYKLHFRNNYGWFKGGYSVCIKFCGISKEFCQRFSSRAFFPGDNTFRILEHTI